MTGRWWSTRTDGDPTACAVAASGLAQVAARVSTSSCLLGRGDDAAQWTGGASAAALAREADAQGAIRHLTERLRRLSDAVERLGKALARVDSALAEARTRALQAGLPTTCDSFHAPADDPAALLVSAARSDERAAHARMAADLRDFTEGGLVRRALTAVVSDVLHLPPSDGDALDDVAWLVSLPGAADLFTDARKAAIKQGALALVTRATVSDLPHAAGLGAVAVRAGPLAERAMKACGPVGSVLTVATAGRDQWQVDADDRRLSTADRVGRTAVRGALGGGTALAGGIAGGEAGAALGTMVLPGIGTMVGGVVGSAAGAFAATELGRASVDAAVEGVDDVIDLAGDAASAVGDAASGVGEAVGDAAGAVGDAAGAVGDAAREVGDRILFWN